MYVMIQAVICKPFQFQMNTSDPCVPWYFPISNNSTSRLCNPWEAREFRFHMSSIPYETCNYCLPDCTTTMYSSSVTAAPFRRCNYKNLGVSFLCNFEETIQPPIWSQGKNISPLFKQQLMCKMTHILCGLSMM